MKLYVTRRNSDGSIKLECETHLNETHSAKYIRSGSLCQYVKDVGGEIILPRPAITCVCGNVYNKEEGVLTKIMGSYYFFEE